MYNPFSAAGSEIAFSSTGLTLGSCLLLVPSNSAPVQARCLSKHTVSRFSPTVPRRSVGLLGQIQSAVCLQLGCLLPGLFLVRGAKRLFSFPCPGFLRIFPASFRPPACAVPVRVFACCLPSGCTRARSACPGSSSQVLLPVLVFALSACPSRRQVVAHGVRSACPSSRTQNAQCLSEFSRTGGAVPVRVLASSRAGF
jgi:hypothetical protein